MRKKSFITKTSLLAGRIPYKMIIGENGDLLFKWLYTGNKKITEPFFDETISACLSLPENSDMPFTSAETVIQRANEIESIEPAAFIFHISRCGSTLLSQMLCMDENCLALSEVPLLDDLLRLPVLRNEKTENIPELYRAVLRVMGEKRSGKEKFLFVKTDSWHLHFFEAIRSIYPEVPALLLYRKPEEVIRSQQKFRGRHAVPGPVEPVIFGFDNSVLEMFADEYLEIVLKSYFEKCIRIMEQDHNSTAISFHDGPVKMLEATLAFCKIEIAETRLSKMRERTKQHSKNPQQLFIPEPEIANRNATILNILFGELGAR